MTPGSPVTVSSDAEYDTAIIRQCKYRLEQEGNRFLEERGDGKIQVQVVFQNGKATSTGGRWNIGEVVSVTVPIINKTNNPMRVDEAEYTETTERYVLIEDEGTI